MAIQAGGQLDLRDACGLTGRDKESNEFLMPLRENRRWQWAPLRGESLPEIVAADGMRCGVARIVCPSGAESNVRYPDRGERPLLAQIGSCAVLASAVLALPSQSGARRE